MNWLKILIENLINSNAEAMARSQELEQIVQNQEAKLRLLAMAGSIPESEIDNIILAQELTEEQIYEAQGEVIPSVASGSGSSRTTTTDPKQLQRSGKSARTSNTAKAEVKNAKNTKNKDENAKKAHAREYQDL